LGAAVTIAAVCPHCETRFQLQPDLVGKTIRCPNGDCREPFEVVEAAAASVEAAPSFADPPTTTDEPIGSMAVGNFLPVLPAEPGLPYERIESDAPIPEVAAESLPTARRLGPAEELPVAKLLPPVRVAKRLDQPAGAQEFDWATMGTDAPPPPLPDTVPSSVAVEDANEPLLFRRQKTRTLPQIILAGLVVATFFFGGGAFVWWLIVTRDTEANRAQQAKEAYDAGNYAASGTQYESLAKDYPSSTNAPKYSFLMHLSKLRATTSSVTAKETPGPGLRAYRDFIKDFADHPLAKPDGEGFARDIYETGRQVIDTQAAHAELKTAEFKADRTKPDDLTTAEKAIDDGRKLIPALQPFKEKDAAPLDPQTAALDKATAGVAFERHRLAVLDPFRTLVENPTDERIEEFERTLVKNKLESDFEAQDLLSKAKAELRRRVVAIAVSVPALAAPPEGDPSVVFSSAIEKPPAPPGSERKIEGPPEVVFGLARGVLTALDVETGVPRWACRVAPATANAKLIDLPARTTLGEGGQELVITPVHLGDKPGLAARMALTGEPIWYQPLEAAVAGRPVILRDRVYAALKDAAGTVAEFDLASGMRVGQIALRQPVGPGMALFPGSGLLYVPAAARRVFVLDINARDEDGKRLPPRCVQILATEHPPDGLLCEPIPVGPPGRSIGQQYLVVAQSVDPTKMKLRAFALPELLADRAMDEVALAPVVELDVPGWAAFPPRTDGERVAVVTDAGHLAIFGVNQLGNLDKAMFTLPVPDAAGGGRELTRGPATEAEALPRGQVVLAEEDGYWVVAGGELKCLKTAVDPVAGLKLSDRVLPARTVGEPLARAQLNSRRDLAVVVVRSPKSFGCRAIGFDPRTGSVKWQRQLGAVNPGPAVRLADGSVVVADEEGGVTVCPALGGDATVAPAPAAWNAGKGVMAPAGKPAVTVSPDGQSAWVLIPEMSDKSLHVRIRRVAGGSVVSEVSLPLPALIAGKPLALGDAVLVPLADGIVHRFTEKTGKLLPGPTWRAAANSADSTCFLAATAKPDEFFGTDGNQKMNRWTWPAGESDAWKAVSREAWETVGTIPFAPVAIAAGGQELVLIADPAGVTVFAANAPSEPIKRWKPGKPAKGFAVRTTGTGENAEHQIVLAVEGGTIACINPTVDALAWELKVLGEPAESVGLVCVDNRIYATDWLGRVTVLDASTGKSLARVSPALAGLLPTDGIPALPLSKERILLPLSDGTAVYLLLTE
jgi:hypothetical protein